MRISKLNMYTRSPLAHTYLTYDGEIEKRKSLDDERDPVLIVHFDYLFHNIKTFGEFMKNVNDRFSMKGNEVFKFFVRGV